MVSRFRVSLCLRCRRRRRRRKLVNLVLTLLLFYFAVWGIPEAQAVWVSALVVWAYTVSGGLFSVAYTDVVQGAMGWSGCVVMAFWYVQLYRSIVFLRCSAIIVVLCI